MIHLAPGLDLPLDAVTQTFGILAKRRAGKSYAARRFAEELFKAAQQIVIVDPKGDWWGIRAHRDGKRPGLPIAMLGGERGDITPLEVGSGEVVARMAVEERASMLLDLSLFSKREVHIFMSAFLETLYRLKAKEAFRTPVMLIVDEADAIAPQRPGDGEERMLGAMNDIVRRGGQRGIGTIMITQRSAVLNKNVLSQCEVLIALRTIAPQDLKAMDAWIDVHGTVEQRKTLMESLPSLPTGDAWFWSPGWPTNDGVFQRVHIQPIETFDSGATPKAGEVRSEPKQLADIDLDAFRKHMASTIEKAKADDPKQLRARIRELEAEVRAAHRLVPEPISEADVEASVQERVARAIEMVGHDVITQLREVASKTVQALSEAQRAVDTVETVQVLIGGEITRLESATQGYDRPPSPRARGDTRRQDNGVPNPVIDSSASIPRARSAAVTHASSNGAGGVGRTPQRMLAAIRFYERHGQPSPSKAAVAAFAGIRHTTGTYSNYLSELRTAGLIEDVSREHVALTPAGRRAAPDDAPSSLEAFHQLWMGKVGGTPGRMLEVLIRRYPKPIAKASLAAAVGVSHTTGTFSNYLSELRVPGLIRDVSRSEVVATELLFPEGLR